MSAHTCSCCQRDSCASGCSHPLCTSPAPSPAKASACGDHTRTCSVIAGCGAGAGAGSGAPASPAAAHMEVSSSGTAATHPPFPFPFPPYDIQLKFMEQLYSTLDDGHVGIFESPTGTGKTLSIICSAVLWLKERREKELRGDLLHETGDETAATSQPKPPPLPAPRLGGATAGADDDSDDSDEPSWVINYSRDRLLSQRREELRAEREAEDSLRARLALVRSGRSPSKRLRGAFGGGKRRRRAPPVEPSAPAPATVDDPEGIAEMEDQFVVSDSNSDSDSDGGSKSKWRGHDGEEEEVYVPKLVFCSRTHSQLSQFVQEIKKTKFGVDLRVVALGSRKTLCINAEVRALSSVEAMNDRCLQLRDKKPKAKPASGAKRPRSGTKKKGGGCPYLGTADRSVLRDEVLAQPHDIEELAAVGRRLHVCPYYGSRAAITSAEVVALPYSMLLHKSTRQTLGLSLKKCIVVIDEGHNLIDAINDVHSARLSLRHIACAHAQLQAYVTRYRSRLLGSNRLFCDQLLHVLRKFLQYIRSHKHLLSATAAKVVSMATFLHSTALRVDLFKLARYLTRSQLSRKLKGFCNVVLPQVETHGHRKPGGRVSPGSGTDTSPSTVAKDEEPAVELADNASAMQSVQSFITALNSSHDEDGRVVLRLSPSGAPFLKCKLLDPAIHFREVVNEARSIIIAGGTMEPISHVVQQLFGHLPRGNVDIFSCGHVIDPGNLLAVSLPSGPTGTRFKFNFTQRTATKQLDELGRVLVNTCAVVPGGVVCFLASYAYAEVVDKHFRKTGIAARLRAKKKVFHEPRAAGDLETTWKGYQLAVEGGSGALLLCVVGGKMSEGINFSNDLARCVVVVGLPYPNVSDPELRETMDFLDKRERLALPSSAAPDTPVTAGRRYYEDACMKAVNQSIGRSIRHREDHAVILLVDARYTSPLIINKLPKWIQQRLMCAPTFSSAYSQMAAFFRRHRSSAGTHAPDSKSKTRAAPAATNEAQASMLDSEISTGSAAGSTDVATLSPLR